MYLGLREIAIKLVLNLNCVVVAHRHRRQHSRHSPFFGLAVVVVFTFRTIPISALYLVMSILLTHPIGDDCRGHMKLHTQKGFIFAENPTHPIEAHTRRKVHQNKTVQERSHNAAIFFFFLVFGLGGVPEFFCAISVFSSPRGGSSLALANVRGDLLNGKLTGKLLEP